jgi:phage terminase large subunit-like protein
MAKKTHPSVKYARDVVSGKETAPKYVIKQCREFLHIVEDKSDKFMINWQIVSTIDAILKLMIMPKGMRLGESMYKCLEGYQWILYVATFATVYRNNSKKRRYQTALLEIARKNFKTFTVGIAFILLFILEPALSKFYSVAPDGSLSREVKEAISDILKMSPLLYSYNGHDRFKILRDYIEFKLNGSKYFPLNYSNSRMDGRLPNVFLADEVGALPNSYAIEAMRSGQLNILNKLGFIISTKYPTIDNPFEDEVDYAKKILDGVVDDDAVFALLYEPDNTDDWMFDDNILKHANPVALHNEEIWNDLLKRRQRAIEVPSSRQNFLTKHCNIIYQGLGTESYVDITDVQRCRVDYIDWYGRDVYVGVDLSMTNDNTSVSFVSIDNGVLYANSFAFIPADRIDEKSKVERLDYRLLCDKKSPHVYACGEKTIDYGFVENFVFDLEDVFGVNVVQIGFDRYNAISSAQKWENGNGGMHKGYDVVEIKQHSSVLHPATKLLSEKIENGQFRYETNELLEINFQNARCTMDTNQNRYVNKKKSTGKVDMVVSLINATYLIQQDLLANGDGFVSMVI